MEIHNSGCPMLSVDWSASIPRYCTCTQGSQGGSGAPIRMETNFMQVGDTIACGHCQPQNYAKAEPCACNCHSKAPEKEPLLSPQGELSMVGLRELFEAPKNCDRIGCHTDLAHTHPYPEENRAEKIAALTPEKKTTSMGQRLSDSIDNAVNDVLLEAPEEDPKMRLVEEHARKEIQNQIETPENKYNDLSANPAMWSPEAPTDESWVEEMEELPIELSLGEWSNLEDFIVSLLQKEREKGYVARGAMESQLKVINYELGKSEALQQVQEMIENKKFFMNVDEYLLKVTRWDGTNYDVPFTDGYKQAKLDLSTEIKKLLN